MSSDSLSFSVFLLFLSEIYLEHSDQSLYLCHAGVILASKHSWIVTRELEGGTKHLSLVISGLLGHRVKNE